MATTLNSSARIVTMEAYPQGRVSWWNIDVSLDAADTFVDASVILAATGGSLIIDAADGGNAALVINGGATGLSITPRPNSGSGNILFRSNVDGTPVAAIGATANLKLQVLIRG